MGDNKLNTKNMLSYYEYEAKNIPMFNSLREISLAENILAQFPKRFRNVLDIGCGEGYLLHRIRKHNKSDKNNKKALLYGLDITEGRTKATKKNVSSALVLRADASSLPFPDNSFDVVVCSEVLEHIPEYEKIIDEIIRISRNKIIITVPNDQALTKTMCPKCETEHYLDGHVNTFNNKKLRKILKKDKIRRTAKIRKIKKFHTIYSYNRLTLKFPLYLRISIDQILISLHKQISFLKPNFLMAVLEKRRPKKAGRW